MTTYTISQDSIIVTFDNSSAVLSSEKEMDMVLTFLVSDFLLFLYTLSANTYKYRRAYNMINRMRVFAKSHPHFIIYMLRDLFSLIRRCNYPNFRIIFVKEI